MARVVGITGGWPVGKDGRIHGIYTHNPSSLRLSMHDPNLQQIPRGSDSEVQKWVKQCFVAGEGNVFWERDFSAIEAVLVGYFAGCPRYIRFAKLGVHAYLASHIVGRPADLALSDDDLRKFFKVLKKEEKATYDTAKRIVHGSNYMMTPSKMHYEYPETFKSTKEAAKLQDLYFSLFPEIREWHRETCLRVDGTRKSQSTIDADPWTLGVAYAQNPFGYIHRFYNVIDWELVEYEGRKEWLWSYGDDAKRLISFLPQSTAAAIIKQAAKRLWAEFPWVGETIRLLIHDSILGECPVGELDTCAAVSAAVMESAIPELPLDPSWGMGEYLTIGSEFKSGKCWADME